MTADSENKHLLCDLSRLVNVTDIVPNFTKSPESFACEQMWNPVKHEAFDDSADDASLSCALTGVR